jgi:hypothetical protein
MAATANQDQEIILYESRSKILGVALMGTCLLIGGGNYSFFRRVAAHCPWSQSFPRYRRYKFPDSRLEGEPYSHTYDQCRRYLQLASDAPYED